MALKYIIIIGDGMADEPLPELGNRTPLEYATTPNLDRLAREGACGMLCTIPEGCEAGSDIANLSILGYDPKKYYTGRGPIEARSMGVDLGSGDVAYRCNLVTVEDGVMRDFSAGHITSAEGKEILSALQKELPDVFIKSGVSYRNLLVVPNGKGSRSTPPHDIVGKMVADYLPVGGDSPLLIRCMDASRRVFAPHPVNAERRRSGKPAVTQVWPWSGGKSPQFPLFKTRYGKTGGIISAVDLLNGIGRCIGMEIIRVPGATGYLDTDYQAKARYALDAIRHLDFMYLHVEAPDEAGHLGSIKEKVLAIERFDGLVGTILDGFDGIVAVLPDHPTPIRKKTHTADPVPFVIRGRGSDATVRFTEREAENGMFGTNDAVGFLEFLFA